MPPAEIPSLIKRPPRTPRQAAISAGKSPGAKHMFHRAFLLPGEPGQNLRAPRASHLSLLHPTAFSDRIPRPAPAGNALRPRQQSPPGYSARRKAQVISWQVRSAPPESFPSTPRPKRRADLPPPVPPWGWQTISRLVPSFSFSAPRQIKGTKGRSIRKPQGCCSRTVHTRTLPTCQTDCFPPDPGPGRREPSGCPASRTPESCSRSENNLPPTRSIHFPPEYVRRADRAHTPGLPEGPFHRQ